MVKPQIETYTESHVYKYPKAEEIAIEQFGIFWSAEELGVHNDESDLRDRLTKAELEAIVYLQSILNKYEDHLMTETRYAQLKQINPEKASALLALNKAEAQRRYKMYQRYAAMDYSK